MSDQEIQLQHLLNSKIMPKKLTLETLYSPGEGVGIPLGARLYSESARMTYVLSAKGRTLRMYVRTCVQTQFKQKHNQNTGWWELMQKILNSTKQYPKKIWRQPWNFEAMYSKKISFCLCLKNLFK